MCAVIASPDEDSADGYREPRPDVADQEISGMWRSAEWTASNERRGSPNGYGWKVGIEGRRKRAACERTLNHGVQVCVASSRGNAVAEIHFQLGFRPHGTKCS